MKVKLEEARRFLNFDEEKLVETYHILEKAHDDKRNVFSLLEDGFPLPLPDNLEFGSEKHASYLFLATIPNIFTGADELFRDLKNLHEKNPDFFNIRKGYEGNREKLEIVERRAKSGRTVKKLVPIELDKVYQKFIPSVGLHQQAALSHYKTCRKIVKWYDGNATNVLKDVSDPDVAYRRLDIGRSYEHTEDLLNDRSSPRFGGMGSKTGTLLVMWLDEAGFLKKMDETDMYSPLDTHALNLLIGRGVIKLENPTRVVKVTSQAQKCVRDTFKKYGLSAKKFHQYQWDLGHSVCYTGNCESTIQNEMSCPFPPDICNNFLDTKKYRKGWVAPTKNGYANM